MKVKLLKNAENKLTQLMWLNNTVLQISMKKLLVILLKDLNTVPTYLYSFIGSSTYEIKINKQVSVKTLI
jgi:hypothetical protein